MLRGSLSRSAEGARDLLDSAARTVRFMDATGLKPTRASRATWAGTDRDGWDHTQAWAIDRRYLLTTEPYGDGPEPWCQRDGWAVQAQPEWGMWNPPGTTLYLCCPPWNGLDLQEILDRLAESEPIPLEHRKTAGVIKSRPRVHP